MPVPTMQQYKPKEKVFLPQLRKVLTISPEDSPSVEYSVCNNRRQGSLLQTPLLLRYNRIGDSVQMQNNGRIWGNGRNYG